MKENKSNQAGKMNFLDVMKKQFCGHKDVMDNNTDKDIAMGMSKVMETKKSQNRKE